MALMVYRGDAMYIMGFVKTTYAVTTRLLHGPCKTRYQEIPYGIA
jgi:hypothetical protein